MVAGRYRGDGHDRGRTSETRLGAASQSVAGSVGSTVASTADRRVTQCARGGEVRPDVRQGGAPNLPAGLRFRTMGVGQHGATRRPQHRRRPRLGDTP